MIRFILKRKQRLVCGAEVEDLYHIDDSIFELEKALRDGGFGEDIYDINELVGVELLDDPSIEMPKKI